MAEEKEEYISRHTGKEIDDAVDNVYDFPGSLILPGFEISETEETEHRYTEEEAKKYIPLIMQCVDFNNMLFKRPISISCTITGYTVLLPCIFALTLYEGQYALILAFNDFQIMINFAPSLNIMQGSMMSGE